MTEFVNLSIALIFIFLGLAILNLVGLNWTRAAVIIANMACVGGFNIAVGIELAVAIVSGSVVVFFVYQILREPKEWFVGSFFRKD